MGLANPYQEGPVLFKVVGIIIGLIIFYTALELMVTGGRLFDTGLVSEQGLLAGSAYIEPHTIVLIFASFLYLIFGAMIMYRAYWVRAPLYVLFAVTYLDTLYRMIVALDLWGSLFNITLLILTATYVVWHAKYIRESFSWGILQWPLIFFITLNFALGPLAAFLPLIPNITDILEGVGKVGVAIWSWFYSAATTV